MVRRILACLLPLAALPLHGAEPWPKLDLLPPTAWVIEDYTDMVTVQDTSWNDFSGNLVAPGEDARGPLAPAVRMVNDRQAALFLAWEASGATTGDLAGCCTSLFGMHDTKVTFDGERTLQVTFPEHALDLDRLDGDLEEPGGPRRAESLVFDLANPGEADVHLDVDLVDARGGTRTARFVVPAGLTVHRVTWNFREGELGDLDVHAARKLCLRVGAGGNPLSGRIALRRLALVADRTDEPPGDDDELLDLAARRAYQYFLDWTARKDGAAGLSQDRSTFGDLLRSGGIGFALAAHAVAAERKWLARRDAAARALRILRILDDPGAFGPEPVGRLGHEGWLYRFLGLDARRKINFDYADSPVNEAANTVELSPVDTALAMMGVLVAQSYFDAANDAEIEIRRRAQAVYDRVNWTFLVEPESRQFYLGWKPNEPRQGLPYAIPDAARAGAYAGRPGTPATFRHYSDETALLALLASGSLRRDVPAGLWCAWPRDADEQGLVRNYSGSLSTYELLHAFLDTRSLALPACTGQPAEQWFDNTTRALQRAIAAGEQTRRRFKTYGPDAWGIAAAEGPFEKYFAYGLPALARSPNPIEDGTVTYYAMVGAVGYGPTLKKRAARAVRAAFARGHWHPRFGLPDAFHEAVNEAGLPPDVLAQPDAFLRGRGPWVQRALFVMDQGPLLLHLENARSGLIWRMVARNVNIQRALERLAAPAEIVVELEKGEGDGQVIQRSSASGLESTHLKMGQKRIHAFVAAKAARYTITAKYSNDNYGPPEKVTILIDGAAVGTFKAHDTSFYDSTGVYGSGWNVYATSDALGPIAIAEGEHTVAVHVAGGDGHGVEIDAVFLKPAPEP